MRANWFRWVVGAVIGIPTALIVAMLLDVPEAMSLTMTEVPPEEIPLEYSNYFERRPASLRLERCLRRSTPVGKDRDIVLGCRVSIDAKDFDAWLASFSFEKYYAVYGVPAAYNLFDVGAPVPVTTVFSDEPPDEGKFYGPILFANADRTEALIYIRFLLVFD